MPDNPSVVTHVNPFQDPVTVAWSAVDAAADRLASSDEEIPRLDGKLEKAKADVARAEDALKTAHEQKAKRGADLSAARDALAAVEEAEPDLAETVRARRTRATHQRINEIQAELARLKEEGK